MKVEMRGIARRFGRTEALKGVDLELRPGEVHALLGENGAGKSTLMHVLSGSLSPDAGEILVDGERVRLDSPRRARGLGIAMVHQHFALVPAFTVAENLALDARPTRGRAGFSERLSFSPAAAAEAALTRAAGLGWTLPGESLVGSLPVGTQQRVEIVKALATGARTLIFDEPTAVLAAGEVRELFDVLARLRSEGCTVVLIAHKLSEILDIADRVTVLRHGQVTAALPRAEADARRLAGWMMGVTPATGPAPGPERERRDDASAIDTAVASTPGFSASEITITGDRGEPAIRGISFEVGRGEIFGIGGVDGNGQSELAEALVGLRPFVSGLMEWHGDVFKPGISPTTAYIPQDRRRAGLAVTMTVEENLLLDATAEPAFRAGPFLKRRRLRAAAADLVQRFDIRAASLDMPVTSLSGGNQQKVVVARALRREPEWLVALNPTRGLDIGAAQFVREQLRAAARRGAAIVLISTDLDEIAAMSRRAAILSSGALREYDPAAASGDDIGLLMGGLPEARTAVEDHGPRT